MDLKEAATLAKTLINEKCPEYKFKWDNAVRRFGSCNYKRKTITLSKPLTKLNEVAHVKNTILHEIAHALTPYQHHNRIWQQKAAEIGCIPTRCYSPEVIRPKAKYQYQCPNCHEVYNRNRAMNVACGLCCNKYNDGKYASVFQLQLVKPQEVKP